MKDNHRSDVVMKDGHKSDVMKDGQSVGREFVAVLFSEREFSLVLSSVSSLVRVKDGGGLSVIWYEKLGRKKN